MATTVKEKVQVSELSKFGFKVGQEYVNYSKQLSEGDKARVVPGAEFDAELYVSDSGKRYLNKVLSATVAPSPVAVSTPTVDAERAKKFTPKFNKAPAADTEKMSKADWSAKDRSQLIGGLSHDAAAITASLVNVLGGLSEPAEALVLYKKLLEGMLQIRDEVK